MNQKKSSVLLRIAKVFSVMLILATFLFFFVFCVFLPRTTYSNYDSLTPFPEFSFSALADGSYTAQLSAYFSDTVFGKDNFKIMYTQIKSFFGKETVFVTEDGDSEVIIGNVGDPNKDPLQNESSGSNIIDISEPSDWSNDYSEEVSNNTSNDTSDESDSDTSRDESTPPPSTSTDTSSQDSETSKEEGDPFEDLCDGICILGNRALEVYYGDPNRNTLPRFANALKSFANKNPSVNVMSMMIPKSCAYYIAPSKNFGHLADRTLNDYNALKDLLGNTVTTIDIYGVLEKHKNEDIYFRTDHHWTGLGAYYAAEQLAKQLGLPFENLSTYEKNVRPGYLGTMDRYTNRHPNIHDYPEDFVTYVPDVSYQATFYDQNFQNGFNRDSLFFRVGDNAVSSWYLAFINGDAYSVQLKSNDCKNGRKLLIVKDSYGNALAPYFLHSFEEVYIVDAREFQVNLNTFVKDRGITDVLFAECAYSAIGSSYISDVENLVK